MVHLLSASRVVWVAVLELSCGSAKVCPKVSPKCGVKPPLPLGHFSPLKVKVNVLLRSQKVTRNLNTGPKPAPNRHGWP